MMNRRIKLARAQTGLTQEEFAAKLGFAKQTYIDIELGRTDPRVKTVRAIAKISDCNLMWLIEGNEASTTAAEIANQLLQLSEKIRHF